jgi:hypothetical protein
VSVAQQCLHGVNTPQYCHLFRGDCRRGMDWILDLLTTYTRHSELQVITALSRISTLYKSPQHPLILFCPAVCSPALPRQRLLTMEILQLHALRLYLHNLPYRTSYQLKYSAVFSEPPLRNSVEPLSTDNWVRVEVTLRPVGQSVSLGVEPQMIFITL